MGKIAVFEGFAGARSPQLRDYGVNGDGKGAANLQPATDAAPVIITRRHLYQSYFDSTALQQAILEQPMSSPIVPSTLREEQVAGYAVGLAPWSEAPVTLQFKQNGAAAGSGHITLAPGHIVRTSVRNPFSGFVWGLPFGWLGGGITTLCVFQSPDSEVDWGQPRPEIVFHRQRLKINIVTTDLSALTKYPNWPTRFPTLGAQFYASGNPISQGGSGILAVEPTRTVLSLRATTPLSAAADMRCLLYGFNEFDTNSAGAAVVSTARFQDVTWPTWSEIGANPTDQFPFVEYQSGPLVRLGAESASGVGLVLIESVASSGLANLYVDVVRYGRL